MPRTLAFQTDILNLDAEAETSKLLDAIRRIVTGDLRRRGAVVGVSGGIDSAVVAALCARALGPDRVIALFTPEDDSSPDSLRLGRLLTESLGIRSEVENISPILNGARCYERRDEAIRRVVPWYDDRCKMKIVLPAVLDSRQVPLFSLVVQSPSGEITRARLTPEAYLGILAATNCKQRARKIIEYYYADRFQYAVAGTPNRLEYDQGFFVKNGDGSADFKPIAHLYKCQVYQLAAFLGVPQEIQDRQPTTDTYSLEQSQEEFYFALPLEGMDLCLYGLNNGIPVGDMAAMLGLAEEQVKRVYETIERRRVVSRYLHSAPIFAEKIG